MGQADHVRTTRRTMLAATFALSGAAGAGGVLAVDAALSSARAEAPHPDAALLAYAPRLQALKAEMAARLAVLDDIEAAFQATLPPRPEWEDPAYAAWAERWRIAKDASGYETAYAAFGTAVDALSDAYTQVAGIRASTLAGLCLKARYGEGADAVEASIIADLRAIDAARPAT